MTTPPKSNPDLHIAGGGAHESISDDGLADLLRKMLSKEGGIGPVIDILNMRFYAPKEESPVYSGSLIAVARDVLSMYPFPVEGARHDNLDFELAQIAQICLKGPEGINAATDICRHLAEASADYHIHAFDYPRLLNILAGTHPFVFLDVFLGNDKIEDYRGPQPP